MTFETVRLGDVAEITMGQSPKSIYYNFNGEGMPFLQGNRTFGYRYPLFDTYTTMVTKKALAGDIIMSVRAPVGDLNFTPVDMCLGRGVCSIRIKDGNQEYLFYLLKNNISQLINKESGTVFGSVNRNDIANWELNIVDCISQKRIASVLSALDSKIELNNKINENLEQQAQAIFKNHFESAKLQMVRFGDISTFKYGKMPIKDRITDIGYPLFSGYQIVGYYPEKMFDEPQIIVVARGVGGCGDIKYTPKNCYLTNLSIAIILNDSVYEDYVYRLLKNTDMKILNTGSAQPQITVDSLQKFELCIPSKKEASSYSEIIKPIKELYRKNNTENQRLSALRDTLLPKLMNGEIDVSEVKI